MKLSDVMSAAGLSGYAEVGLVLFLGVFVAVAARVLWFQRGTSFANEAQLPLDEDASGRVRAERAEIEALLDAAGAPGRGQNPNVDARRHIEEGVAS